MIPAKIKSGDKIATIRTHWNHLVDYLYSCRLVSGPGISIQHRPCGIVISSTRQNSSNNVGYEADLSHPFKVTVSGDKCLVSGGYVTGYSEKMWVADTAFPADGAAFVYLAVTPKVIDHAIHARIEYGAKHDYMENHGGEDVYFFPVAEIISDENGRRTVVQFQIGNLVTPFRRNYIPVIGDSLKCFLMVKEGEGDEMEFMLQERETGGPDGNQHLCTKKNGDLYWHLCEKDSEDEDDSSSSSIISDDSVPSDPDDSVPSDPDESSSSIEILPDKWYVCIYIVTEWGYTYYEGMGMYDGEGLLRVPDDLAGFPLFTYEPQFDENGEYIGDKEIVIGTKRLVILSGPYNSYAEAEVWHNEHRPEYGLG